jgi:hypothetical protein
MAADVRTIALATIVPVSLHPAAALRADAAHPDRHRHSRELRARPGRDVDGEAEDPAVHRRGDRARVGVRRRRRGRFTLSDETLAIVESVPDAARRLADRVESHRRQEDGALRKVEQAATEIEQAAQSATQPVKGVSGVAKSRSCALQRPRTVVGRHRPPWFLGQATMVMFLVFPSSSPAICSRGSWWIAGPR